MVRRYVEDVLNIPRVDKFLSPCIKPIKPIINLEFELSKEQKELHL